MTKDELAAKIAWFEEKSGLVVGFATDPMSTNVRSLYKWSFELAKNFLALVGVKVVFLKATFSLSILITAYLEVMLVVNVMTYMYDYIFDKVDRLKDVGQKLSISFLIVIPIFMTANYLILQYTDEAADQIARIQLSSK